jgi:hypothetical protein
MKQYKVQKKTTDITIRRICLKLQSPSSLEAFAFESLLAAVSAAAKTEQQTKII